MQVVLYLIEEADAQNRLDRLGYALKRYLAVQKVAICDIFPFFMTINSCAPGF